MSIYIEGMEMPTEDQEFIIRISPNGTVMTEYGLPITGAKAVSIPPHGRLIDADAAIANRNTDMNWCYDLDDLPDYLSDCPTVIPAEEGNT